MTLFKGNRKYPNPATVTDDPRTHTLALQQIIEALNVGQRRVGTHSARPAATVPMAASTKLSVVPSATAMDQPIGSK